jgi:digeranylgeranylglycerophospholipid reductase
MVTGGVSTCPPIKETVRDGIAMVGDAARHIDPITGGGIGNGCLAGMILGKVLSDIKQRGGTYSKQDLQPYETGWRAELEETLYRNWMAKNKLVTLSDEDFDKIIATLSTAGIEKLSIHAMLKVIKERLPELVSKFADII